MSIQAFFRHYTRTQDYPNGRVLTIHDRTKGTVLLFESRPELKAYSGHVKL